MGKPTKRTKKFISTKLDSHIKARKEHQKKKKIAQINQERKSKKIKDDRKGRGKQRDEDELNGESEGSSEDEEDAGVGGKPLNEMSVEEFLAQGLAGSEDDDDDDEDAEEEAEEDLSELEEGDEGEDEEIDEEEMMKGMKALAEKDPDFFKYLQENDAELLNFDPDQDTEMDSEEGGEEDEEGEDEDDDDTASKKKRAEDEGPQVVTLEMLRNWQRAILQHRSLRALRRLLLAFRAAAQLNNPASSTSMDPSDMSKRKRKAMKKGKKVSAEDAASAQQGMYIVQDAAVYQKVIQTALKYTPLVLQHHVPYKEVHANGAGGSGKGKGKGSSEGSAVEQVKYKFPTQTKKYAQMQRPLQSFFFNLSVLLRTLPDGRTRGSDDDDEDSEDEDGGPKKGKKKKRVQGEKAGLLRFVVEESSRMIPYIVGNQRRKMVRDYLKILLELWSTADDSVRIAAFLSIRKIASAGDEVTLDACLKGAYHSFVRSTKLTTQHTLSSINLMKNSASQLYLLNLGASYQHAFGFIRQLAVHLRNCLQTKSNDSYKNVYNSQFVHCIDFWSLILSTTCDQEAFSSRDSVVQSPLEPLIYPLVQVALGAIRLIPTSRYFPLRLHVIRSLLRIVQRTGTYIPLSPYLVEMLDAPEFQRKAKGTTLKPLDLEVNFRAPLNYLRTSVYAGQIAEEVQYLLLEFVATQARSLAFPELSIPISVQLRRTMKTFAHSSTSNKTETLLRTLLDKVAQQKVWVEKRRQGIDYAPASLASKRKMDAFLKKEGPEGPLEAALKLAKKVRTQKKKLLEQSKVQIDQA